MAKEINSFKQTDILTAVNNAIVYASKPGKIPQGISTSRAGQLRLISQELIKPVLRYADESNPDKQLLTYEELVFILLTSAAFVQLQRVMGRNTLPSDWKAGNGISQEVQEKVNKVHGK